MAEIEKITIDETEEDASNNRPSIIALSGEILTDKNFITDPAIAREDEIKKLIITLLTPEKSGILVGKAGIGKTAIVEGLAYRILKGQVPDKLKGYRIIKISSASLIGKITVDGHEEMIINVFMEEVKAMSNVIVFIDEIHTLMGAKGSGPMDLANTLKPLIDRGDGKLIGATTNEEYYTYVIRDRAFLRRFEKIDVLEPDRETTARILLETLPKIEKQTGIQFKYKDYVARQLMESIVDATSEFKRIYGLSAMYPDIAFSVLTQAFSHALFDNKAEVGLIDVYNAIKTSKRIYPDSIVKELAAFRDKFAKQAEKDDVYLPKVTIDDIEEIQEF